MDQKRIDRINALARKSRETGLTEEEKQEQALLRREYVDSVLGSLRSQLDGVVLVDEKGRKTKLRKKGE